MAYPEHEKNRAFWNEIVPIHVDHPLYRTAEFLEGKSKLKWIDKELAGDVKGKTLLHLMCQFGLDTLSWAREGAIVTGVDISDTSIEEAHKLAAKAGLSARWVRSDVMDLIGQIDEKFDIVYQSYGTYIWLADLAQWGKVVAHHLKTGGKFIMVDGHPVDVLFDGSSLTYFSREPELYQNSPDYCDRNYHAKNESAEYQHTMSEVIMSLVNAGLRLEHFQEYDFGYYPVADGWYEVNGYWYPPSGPSRHPLIFSLVMRKD